MRDNSSSGKVDCSHNLSLSGDTSKFKGSYLAPIVGQILVLGTVSEGHAKSDDYAQQKTGHGLQEHPGREPVLHDAAQLLAFGFDQLTLRLLQCWKAASAC